MDLPHVEKIKREVKERETDKKKRLILFASLIKSETGMPLLINKVKELSDEKVNLLVEFFEL